VRLLLSDFFGPVRRWGVAGGFLGPAVETLVPLYELLLRGQAVQDREDPPLPPTGPLLRVLLFDPTVRPRVVLPLRDPDGTALREALDAESRG
jgi:hypothetical protein